MGNKSLGLAIGALRLRAMPWILQHIILFNIVVFHSKSLFSWAVMAQGAVLKAHLYRLCNLPQSIG
jgi:hypothetical protein